MYFISIFYRIFLVLLILLVLYVAYSSYSIIKKHDITSRNLEFIRDIYEKLNDTTKIKVDNVVEWHKIHSHPFLVERSMKVSKTKQNKQIINNHQTIINNNRMTIVISLSYFFKDMKGTIDEEKWIQWRNILEIPSDIEGKCIEYLVKGEGSVDFIWGIDLDTNKEKFYLENPRDNRIYSYVFPLSSSENPKIPKETYEYHKVSFLKKNLDKFRFYYKRFNNFNETKQEKSNLNIKRSLSKRADSYIKRGFSKEADSYIKRDFIDSYHFFLKELIRINNCVIHIVSISKNTVTIYYFLK